jgi:hypothetical protein
MVAIERTAYPRFKPALTANELQDLYCPTDEERDFISTQARGATQQLTLLTLLSSVTNIWGICLPWPRSRTKFAPISASSSTSSR